MDKSYNDDIRPLLDLNDSLPALLQGKIDFPIIASCGMQSHGKSSTLESITHISLPKGEGTVTVCPIKISLRNARDEEFARIKFELDKNDKYEKITLDQIADKIMEYQNKVRQKHNVNEKENKLFDEVIQVEVNRKNAPNLTLYDLPGLNFNEKIKEKSKEINEKFLKDKNTTVLLVISGSEDATNSYAIDWMKDIPDYKERFIAIITKADALIDRDLEVYLNEITALNLENSPTLLVNKFKKYNNLSYDQMEKKETELINQIPKIDNYPKINKGIQALINQLITIQKRHLLHTFSDIASKIKTEIEKSKTTLKKLPKMCESKEEFFWILEDCLTKFKKEIENRQNVLKVKEEDGSPDGNLLKYEIKLKYIAHIKKVKQKINDVFTLAFCNQVTNNIVQYNSDHIPILEDDAIFNNLLKPKINDILSNFEITINNIYEYMLFNINPAIDISFKNFELLKRKVMNLYKNYAKDQKEKMLNFYEEIKSLEEKNVSTFNVSIIEKVNSMNKHINYFLFGKNKYKKNSEKKKCLNNLKKGLKVGLGIINPNAAKVIDNIDNINPNQNQNNGNDQNNEAEDIEEDEKEEEKKEEIKEEEKKEEKKEEEDDDGDKTFKIIDDLNSEVYKNPNFGEIVKKKYQKNSELKKNEIISNYKYERQREIRRNEKDEFSGRIKIAYIEHDIETFYERIIDENIVNSIEYKDNEFIPGFQYINRVKLEEFQRLISEGKIQMKTANLITKMVAYLEIMLNRILDTIYLSIQKYLYDRLTNDDMIKFIRNKIHLMKFSNCKKLIEEKQGLNKQIDECKNNIKNLKEALDKIRGLKFEDMVFLEEEEDEEENGKEDYEEDEEEEEKEKNNNNSNNNKK